MKTIRDLFLTAGYDEASAVRLVAKRRVMKMAYPLPQGNVSGWDNISRGAAMDDDLGDIVVLTYLPDLVRDWFVSPWAFHHGASPYENFWLARQVTTGPMVILLKSSSYDVDAKTQAAGRLVWFANEADAVSVNIDFTERWGPTWGAV